MATADADRGAPAGYLLHQYKRYKPKYPPTTTRPLSQILPSFSSFRSDIKTPRYTQLRDTSSPCRGFTVAPRRWRRPNSDLAGLEKFDAVRELGGNERQDHLPRPVQKEIIEPGQNY